MLQWIKDWAPILATIGALSGVIITVGHASKTYTHGLIEKRKDHQRELLGDLIANTNQWRPLAEVGYMALAKMDERQMTEWANSDAVRIQGEYAKAMQIGLIKCLSEIGDRKIHRLVAQLTLSRQELTDGDEVKALFDYGAPDKSRTAAFLVMLGRLSFITRTCNELQVAVIEALRVEIAALTLRQRFWNWLRGANIVVNPGVTPHY